MLVTTCSKCGEKLHKSIEVDENISIFCHSCWAKSKNGQKLVILGHFGSISLCFYTVKGSDLPYLLDFKIAMQKGVS